MKTGTSTTFKFRLKHDLYNWLKAFSERENRPMAEIIKEELEGLRRKERRARKTPGATENERRKTVIERRNSTGFS